MGLVDYYSGTFNNYPVGCGIAVTGGINAVKLTCKAELVDCWNFGAVTGGGVGSALYLPGERIQAQIGCGICINAGKFSAGVDVVLCEVFHSVSIGAGLCSPARV